MTHKWAMHHNMLTVLAINGEATIEEVNAAAMGGGKAVIFDPNFDPKNFSDVEKGEPLNSLERRLLREGVVPVLLRVRDYIFAPDVGTDTRWVDYVSRFAPHNVACLSTDLHGSGDPSIITARGVYLGMLEAVKYNYGRDSLDGMVISIQGLGKVGSYLIRNIAENNSRVKLIITDTKQERVQEQLAYLKDKGIEVRYIPPEEIFTQKVDIFSPNAIGQILSPENVRKMVAVNPENLIIAGAANNQLEDRIPNAREEVEELFRQHGVLYAPDFTINLGGIHNLIYEFPRLKQLFGGYDQIVPLNRIRGVTLLLDDIFALSRKHTLSTQAVAEALAEGHIARLALLRGIPRQDIENGNYMRKS